MLRCGWRDEPTWSCRSCSSAGSSSRSSSPAWACSTARRSFRTHANWGYLLEIIPLILLALAVVGRLGRRQILYAAALFGMFILQSVFVALRGDLPMIAALHPVNGFAILLVGILTAREAWLSRRAVAGKSTAIESTVGAASR